MKNRYSYALAGGLITLGALTGCAHSQPSVAACRSALQAEYHAAVTDGTTGTKPAACKGVPVKTITTLVGQIAASAIPVGTAEPVSCKQAMKGTAYASVAAAGDTGTPPASCKGVSLYQQRVWARQDVLGQ